MGRKASYDHVPRGFCCMDVEHVMDDRCICIVVDK